MVNIMLYESFCFLNWYIIKWLLKQVSHFMNSTENCLDTSTFMYNLLRTRETSSVNSHPRHCVVHDIHKEVYKQQKPVLVGHFR